LMQRYEQKLLHYILRVSNVSLEDAEDMLQDVFLKVYQNLNDFDKSLKFSSWIYRITRNHVISQYRKIKSRGEPVSLEAYNGLVDKLASTNDTMREVDQSFLRAQLNKILSTMDTKYREVMVLKYFEDKDYKEISDILKKPMGTVATLLSRAKKQFQKMALESNVPITLDI
jgi:RNA polymerase sigma-70 factor, ECF subfamily